LLPESGFCLEGQSQTLVANCFDLLFIGRHAHVLFQAVEKENHKLAVRDKGGGCPVPLRPLFSSSAYVLELTCEPGSRVGTGELQVPCREDLREEEGVI
jgi:hypothetical protein